MTENLMIGVIVISVVLLYLFMPELMGYVSTRSKGTAGLVFFGEISLVLTAIYYLFGYRGMDLLKIALLILFIAVMIWLYFNYRNVDVLISSRYGQGAATLVFLAVIILIWLISGYLI